MSEQIVPDSKPAKRTKSAPKAKPVSDNPKSASHRHSKVVGPASPVVGEVVREEIVAETAPVTDADIARLAYSFWEQRNFAHGFADEDWHRAVESLAAAR